MISVLIALFSENLKAPKKLDYFSKDCFPCVIYLQKKNNVKLRLV